jgi:hypothetical protein
MRPQDAMVASTESGALVATPSATRSGTIQMQLGSHVLQFIMLINVWRLHFSWILTGDVTSLEAGATLICIKGR